MDKDFTCPAKTLAIIAHNENFEYDSPPDLVKEIAACKSIDHVLELSKGGRLPPISRASSQVSPSLTNLLSQDVTNMAVKLADVVLFNTRVQQNTKLVLWVSLPRHFETRGKTFELLLPHRVAARFVSTVFI